jgi:hypothetical protein
MSLGRITAVMFVLGLMALCVINPSVASLPPCPIHAIFGLYCPGCGSLRSLHSLLNGNILQAWNYNPLVLCVLPIVFLGVIHEFYPHRHLAPSRIRPWILWGLLGVTFTFGILRNTSPFQYLKPQEKSCQQGVAPYGAQVAETTRPCYYQPSRGLHLLCMCAVR